MTIQEFLQGDKFALLAGVELLEAGNGYAKARMEIKPEHLNGGGVCQGGAILPWPTWLSRQPPTVMPA